MKDLTGLLGLNPFSTGSSAGPGSRAGDEYVPDGAWLTCNKGAVPRRLNLLPRTVYLYSENIALETDLLPVVNIPSFAGCAIKGSCTPVPVKWLDPMDNGVLVNGVRPLLNTSQCQCGVGGQVSIHLTLGGVMKDVGGKLTEVGGELTAVGNTISKVGDTMTKVGFWCKVGGVVLGIAGVVALATGVGAPAAPFLLAAARTSWQAGNVLNKAGKVVSKVGNDVSQVGNMVSKVGRVTSKAGGLLTATGEFIDNPNLESGKALVGAVGDMVKELPDRRPGRRKGSGRADRLGGSGRRRSRTSRPRSIDPPGTYRDRNGRLRDSQTNRFVKDPSRRLRNQRGKDGYRRKMKERKKALLRDADDPNSDLSPEARAEIRKTNGNKVPEGYEVSHEEPLYTRTTRKGKEELDVAENMKTQPKETHRARHKKCGGQHHQYGSANKPKAAKP